jgi:predicted O-methyltransferase YrrM
VGRAIDELVKLEPSPPFDLVFIDADKPSNLDYFKQAKRLTRPGGVIVSDYFDHHILASIRLSLNSWSSCPQ